MGRRMVLRRVRCLFFSISTMLLYNGGVGIINWPQNLVSIYKIFSFRNGRNIESLDNVKQKIYYRYCFVSNELLEIIFISFKTSTF